MAKGEVARIGGHTETLTILFTDIAGFTNILEGMSPEDLTNHLAGYFQAMIDAMHHHGATVDKLVGDAIVAFWGAPTPMPDQTDRALQAVLECRNTLEDLKSNLERPGLAGTSDPLRFGHRTSGGGQYGGPTRLAYTVLGDTVNLASRLEGLNKVYGTNVFVDGGTQQAGGDAFARATSTGLSSPARPRPPTSLRCWVRPGKFRPEKLAAARRYEAAWDKYRSGDFPKPLRPWLASRPSSGLIRQWSACGKFARLPEAPTGSGLGRNFPNHDQMRRRQRQKP